MDSLGGGERLGFRGVGTGLKGSDSHLVVFRVELGGCFVDGREDLPVDGREDLPIDGAKSVNRKSSLGLISN